MIVAEVIRGTQKERKSRIVLNMTAVEMAEKTATVLEETMELLTTGVSAADKLAREEASITEVAIDTVPQL